LPGQKFFRRAGALARSGSAVPGNNGLAVSSAEQGAPGLMDQLWLEIGPAAQMSLGGNSAAAMAALPTRLYGLRITFNRPGS